MCKCIDICMRMYVLRYCDTRNWRINCDVPCVRHQYDAILSSSLLDKYKIRDEIKSHEKARELLPRYQEAVEISAQVKCFEFILIIKYLLCKYVDLII